MSMQIQERENDIQMEDISTQYKINILIKVLEDSIDVHNGYPVPNHLYFLARSVLRLSEETITEIFKRYDYHELKKESSISLIVYKVD